MTIGEVGPASASAYSVTLVKGQEKQEATVVNTLIASTAPTAPSVPGVGQKINTVA